MKKKIVLMLFAAVFVFSACTSQKKIESDDDFSVEAESGEGGDDLSLDGGSSESADSGSGQDAAQDDLSLDAFNEDSGSAEQKKPEAAASNDAAQDADLALEDELNSLGDGSGNQAASQQGADELSLDDPAAAPAQQDATAANAAQQPAEGDLELPPEVALNDPAAATQDPAVAQNLTQPTDAAAAQQADVPIVDAAPITAEAAANISVPANITNVQYKGNAGGGTVAISADQPLTYTTRFNATTNQFVVEVQNSAIPKKLKRSLNTKDMASSIGSVDIYQKDGSSVARFVVQLRAGSPEPIVQPEGNSLLIVGGAVGATAQAPAEPISPPDQAQLQADPAVTQAPDSGLSDTGMTAAQTPPPETIPMQAEQPQRTSDMGRVSMGSEDGAQTRGSSPVTGLLSYDNLEDFLMSNTKFYGKKISIETTDMDTADALKFLSEESGVNIMFDDNLGSIGKVNLKLKEVPWDQAFVLILKSKNLAYKRQGNVIRVATVDTILQDEEKAIKLKEKKRKPSDFLVKRFFIGYITAGEARTKVSEYIENFLKIKTATSSNPNSASVDPKGSIIVDDSNNSLIVTDTAENIKKVEEILAAIDIQPKQIQVEAKIVDANENFGKGLGVTWNIVKQSGGDPTGRASFDSGVEVPGQFSAGLVWSNLDFLGTLDANIALGESQGKLKTLASPRITVVSGKPASLSQNTSVEVPTTVISNTGQPVPATKTETVRLGISVTPTATNEGTVKLNVSINRDTGGGTTQVVGRNATTELFVRSGATAVVGGIYETLLSNTEAGIPGLQSVPVIGALFRSKQQTKSKTELMIFLTPTILRGI